MISPDDSIIFGHGHLSHARVAPDIPACETSPQTLPQPLLSGRAHLCPGCRRDLTDSVGVHLYGCVTLPTEVLRNAQATREAVQRLVKQSHQPGDAVDALKREAKDARDALRKVVQTPGHG